MATRETLLELVKSGSDLIVARGMPREHIFELAAAAQVSGARLTVSTNYPADVVIDLSRQYGKTVAFLEGLADFEKD